ncbi:MAG: glutamate formimidoyltransferase [Anaerolineaceae bacterium]|nr:glutamate formimidoyltransferase [Anaerolineaceae bacterium]
MPNPLIECIPNFSEARRPEVVEEIVASITAINGITLLDKHSDLDHNRTVVTFIGAPTAVEEAAFKAIQTAGRLIDLDAHTGEHPRIGATDVVPFVPIAEVGMAECMEIARRLGKRVADELGIPVYLYEEAAARPERQNLENIRRGQYEGLKTEIEKDPDRKPDFGPAKLPKAGATVIGARFPLIAYNVYLTTDDVSIARKIARTVRFSSGGLRYVKGMGVLVDGRAQVSMNLTNYLGTPIPQAVELVRREAARYGVEIHHCELVGLVPQEAMIHAAIWYLQLDDFESHQILESQLASGGSPAENPREVFLNELAAATPTPGGGSAAAYAIAQAAALIAMVARLTLGKKKYAGVEKQMEALRDEADRLRWELNADVDRDAAAFEQLMAAMRLPKESDDEKATRETAIHAATLNAAQVPLEVARKALSVLKLAVEAAELGNLNAISDAGSASALARAGLTGAGYNVRINLLGMPDDPKTKMMKDEIIHIEQYADQLISRMRETLTSRGGLQL